MSARVLVVDDVPVNVRVLEERLVAEYFDVLTAGDGRTALDLARRERPDIVLLDVMMPDIDGYEVCRRLKAEARTCHIPVVMVTALDDTQSRVRGLEAGADDFLTKPVRDVALLARVRSLVRLKQAMDEWRLREITAARFGLVDDLPALVEESARDAHILLVEDSPVECERITRILARDGHRTTASASCEAALEAVRHGDFDLVIVSLLLGREDGLRLCSRIRSDMLTRQTPLLILVDEQDPRRLAKGLELGVNDYLILPLEASELRARVRTQVRRRRYEERLRRDVERHLALALVDGLTGLHNRRFLESHLDSVLARSLEQDRPLSLLMVDIDGFKAINDTFGHTAGDGVLREAASRIAASVRHVDPVARYGGEEFVVVMPDATPQVAATVAERLRRRIADREFEIEGAERPIAVTVSIGVASLAGREETAADLLARADAAMYAAKRAGRDRVATAPPPANAERAAAG